MISSLEEARRWYAGVKVLAQDMERLGRKYWDAEPWASVLSRDNKFRHRDSTDLLVQAENVLANLDDLGVLLMFSVFEAIVRERIRTDVDASLPPKLHPAVEHAVNGLKREIDVGSIKRVMESIRSMAPNLVEEVNQVRVYRNWVAHGRRGKQPALVDPTSAYDRLSDFLIQMAKAVPDA